MKPGTSTEPRRQGDIELPTTKTIRYAMSTCRQDIILNLLNEKNGLHQPCSRRRQWKKKNLAEREERNAGAREREKRIFLFDFFSVTILEMDRARRSTRKRLEREYDGDSSDGETPISTTPAPSAAITTAGVRTFANLQSFPILSPLRQLLGLLS